MNFALRALVPGLDELTCLPERLAFSSDDFTTRGHRNLITGLFLLAFLRAFLFNRGFKSLDLTADIKLYLLLVKALHDALKLCNIY